MIFCVVCLTDEPIQFKPQNWLKGQMKLTYRFNWNWGWRSKKRMKVILVTYASFIYTFSSSVTLLQSFTTANKNQSVDNIIRWFAGTMGQTNRRPSVWCSKYHFLFMISCKIAKNKKRGLSALSIRNNEKMIILGTSVLVDYSFGPSFQRSTLLYCKLTDFKWVCQKL